MNRCITAHWCARDLVLDEGIDRNMQIVQNRPNRRDGIVEELMELCHLCGVIGYNIYVSPQMLWGRCAAALLRPVRAVYTNSTC